MASAILITDWDPLGEKVLEEIEIQIEGLDRKNIIKKSLKNYGAIIITSSIAESINLANKIAPEHLEILTRNPFDIYKNSMQGRFSWEYTGTSWGIIQG